MNNQNDTKRENTTNPQIENERQNDSQTNIGNTGLERENNGILDKEAQGGGLSNTTSNQERQEEDGALDWNFCEIWNKSLEEREERPVNPRNNMWSSELGKPYVDVWLKMKGVEPSNPPNARSLRKFEAGNIWEWLVKLILLRAGILQSEQKWVSFQYPELLEVTGKVDFIAGGKPDWSKAKNALEGLMLPDVFTRAYTNILDYFQEKYPDGLPSKILEIKSVSAFMYDALENGHRNLKIHRLQTYHYLKALNMERGDVVYVCRDDCRMFTSAVWLNSYVEKEYKDYIEEMTKYVKTNTQPPLEKPIIFDEDMGKFSKNNMIAWSPYLTKLYGLEDQNEFDEKYKSVSDGWNRVLGRLKTGKDMTKNNLEKLEQIKEAGFDIEDIKSKIVPEIEGDLIED